MMPHIPQSDLIVEARNARLGPETRAFQALRAVLVLCGCKPGATRDRSSVSVGICPGRHHKRVPPSESRIRAQVVPPPGVSSSDRFEDGGPNLPGAVHVGLSVPGGPCRWVPRAHLAARDHASLLSGSSFRACVYPTCLTSQEDLG